MLRIEDTEELVDFLPRKPLPVGFVPELERRYMLERGVMGEGERELRWWEVRAVAPGWAPAPAEVSSFGAGRPFDVTGVRLLP
jgi:hypothetical protein